MYVYMCVCVDEKRDVILKIMWNKSVNVKQRCIFLEIICVIILKILILTKLENWRKSGEYKGEMKLVVLQNV